MIPVLIGMLWASPLGMRLIVALVIGADLVVADQARLAPAIWSATVSTLVAICFLALRVHAQRHEIAALQKIATDRAERAEQRRRQLADFVELVHYDVREPMVAARMQLQALGDRAGAEPLEWIRARATDALSALAMMSTTLQDLFDIGRSEAGQLLLRRQSLPLREVIESLPRAHARGDVRRVVMEIADDLIVEADRYHLKRIVGNLLDNALKFAGEGTTVVVRGWEDDGNVVIEVEDQGMGIAAEDLPHVFEEGHRGRAARELTDGAGLGLYTVKLLVEAHGGRVRVESEPGHGSTVRVALPRAKGKGRRGAFDACA
jgi:signal transduction histidine kinase